MYSYLLDVSLVGSLYNLIALGVDPALLTLACFVSVGLAVLICLMGFPCNKCPRCEVHGIDQ